MTSSRSSPACWAFDAPSGGRDRLAHNGEMPRRDATWLVLARDVSHAVRVVGESDLSAVMVLEAGTGLVRAAMIGPTEGEALTQALEAAVRKPARPLPAGPPATVLCGPGLGPAVGRTLRDLLDGGPPPDVTEIDPPREAEDLFDSFVGHMAGRDQPDDAPLPEDYEVLYAQAAAFHEAAPWSRWHDGVVLALEITVEGSTTRHRAVVMGNAGVQHGLVVYPGEQAPPQPEEWQPGRQPPMPEGTLLCTLDPPGEPPAEMVAKARRYGWRPDAGLVPVFLCLGAAGGAGDLGRTDAHRMAVALAAVTRHDARGLVATGGGREVTSGKVALPRSAPGRFWLRQQVPPTPAAQPRFQLHQARTELVPVGTPVVLGHMPWASLDELRPAARIHRPAPAEAPPPGGSELPLFAILAQPSDGDRIAARAAELDPFGVVAIETGEGQAVFALVGTNGVEVLMEAAVADQGYLLFERRLRQTEGRHVVMVTEESTAKGKGTVYGLFECHHPALPAPTAPRARPRAAGSKKRRRR